MITLFEQYSNNPEVGDYILTNKSLWGGSSTYPQFDKYVNFINNTPGKIIRIFDNYGSTIYFVKYDNMPKDIDDWLDIHGSRDDLIEPGFNQRKCERYLRKDILVFAKTIEELIIKKETEKYNL